MSESLFCANFDVSFSLFCRKSVQRWMRRFWAKNAEETTYGAYDGPSCMWRSVGPAYRSCWKKMGKSDQVWDYEACDGPSCRFIVKIREVIPVPRFQELKYFETKTLDGPLCLWRSVILAVEGNEESSRRNCTKYGTTQSTKVHCDHDGPSRGPSTQPRFGRFPVITILV